MLGLSHLAGLDRASPSVAAAYISHIHLAYAHQFAAGCHNLKHLGDMLLNAILVVSILKAADVHLCAYTVDLGHSVGLPFLNPVYQALYLLIIVPI